LSGCRWRAVYLLTSDIVAHRLRLSPTPVLLQPSKLYLAALTSGSETLLAAIGMHVAIDDFGTGYSSWPT